MTKQKLQRLNSWPSLDNLVITSAGEAGVKDADLCGFYSENWERPIALARKEFFQWQFSMAPEAHDKNHSVVALADGKIIAVLGAAPRSFLSNGQTRRAAELTTWIVAPEARGHGVGGGILRFLQERYDILTGAGITAQALPLYLKAEFTFLAHIPRFFFVSQFGRLNKFTTPRAAALAAVEKRQSMAQEVPFSVSACQASQLAGAAGAKEFGQSQNVRNAAYLKWRYDNHPVFQYESFLVSDRSGFLSQTGVILRQDDFDGVPFLHLVDVIGASEHFGAAISFMETEARSRGCAFVDASATSGHLHLVFRARGWNSVIDDPLIELPSLFYPLELRRPPTTSLVFWSRDEKELLYDFSRLHFTKGDLDMDRPTLDFYQKVGR